MNILLFLPALMLNLNFHFGLIKTLGSVLFLVVAQLLIGLPFIMVDAKAYFGAAFEFGREFWYS